MIQAKKLIGVATTVAGLVVMFTAVAQPVWAVSIVSSVDNAGDYNDDCDDDGPVRIAHSPATQNDNECDDECDDNGAARVAHSPATQNNDDD